jgi:hypothetical protein
MARKFHETDQVIAIIGHCSKGNQAQFSFPAVLWTIWNNLEVITSQHGGGSGGFTSFAFSNIKADVAGIVLVNRQSALASSLRLQMPIRSKASRHILFRDKLRRIGAKSSPYTIEARCGSSGTPAHK